MYEEQLGGSSAEEAKRLNPDEGQEEANLLRAVTRMGEGREGEGGNSRETVQREKAQPTPEDYDVALKTLTELRGLAADKPRIVFRLWQYLELALISAAVPPAIVATMLAKTLDEQLPRGGQLAREMENESVIDAWKEARDSIFSDANSRLRRLKKASQISADVDDRAGRDGTDESRPG